MHYDDRKKRHRCDSIGGALTKNPASVSYFLQRNQIPSHREGNSIIIPYVSKYRQMDLLIGMAMAEASVAGINAGGNQRCAWPVYATLFAHI
jgi:hypothetical protein